MKSDIRGVSSSDKLAAYGSYEIHERRRFSDAIKQIQRERGSRRSYARLEEQRGGFADAITPEIAAYISERNSAFLSTANLEGQPYVQHRGGPAGFIRVLDPHTLAFADFAGNRQYITTGNLSENDRVFLLLLRSLADPAYEARPILVHVSAWDVNCPQHIPQLVAAERVREEFGVLERRLRYLEKTLRDAGVTFVPAFESERFEAFEERDRE